MDIWINLIMNGLATGMLIFLIAIGLTLIFGLMDVLNFSHGGIFAWGAFSGIWVYTQTGSFLVGITGAIVAGFLLGWLLERFIIRPVYGNHMQQILITLGAMLVLGELIKVVWGPNQLAAQPPFWLAGSWIFGDIVLIKYRLFIILIGLLVFIVSSLILKKTKIGLIVRAGVMDREMIQALGINIKKIFMWVFMVGAGLAALGGVLMGPYSGVIYAEMGMEYAIFAFIVVIIGGMGSITGSMVAAMIVGLASGIMGYYVPELSLAVNMLIMLIVLLFKPEGLFGAKGVKG
ncbi:branched-chain amino acid ABC transporter permease [Hazenella coriacea]|uniref:Amino acid/amide ABC transporter membrane protein 1 (HAAT family) n=1 Tax=Hazenella coriacea TaxID=1179467 RepID=A0A4R3L6S9_9BACL|nr:branched-chain amino acid ABC transporter permease [Hazenella coriacea]TCS93914.1 amino acid/amide ABC transporter membrane protein 1 (HAAT family) [Hazenella coriacea]